MKSKQSKHPPATAESSRPSAKARKKHRQHNISSPGDSANMSVSPTFIIAGGSTAEDGNQKPKARKSKAQQHRPSKAHKARKSRARKEKFERGGRHKRKGKERLEATLEATEEVDDRKEKKVRKVEAAFANGDHLESEDASFSEDELVDTEDDPSSEDESSEDESSEDEPKLVSPCKNGNPKNNSSGTGWKLDIKLALSPQFEVEKVLHSSLTPARQDLSPRTYSTPSFDDELMRMKLSRDEEIHNTHSRKPGGCQGSLEMTQNEYQLGGTRLYPHFSMGIHAAARTGWKAVQHCEGPTQANLQASSQREVKASNPSLYMKNPYAKGMGHPKRDV